MNFFGQELSEYKAALHTHSTNSDGRLAPDQVIQAYADGGYDVLAFTDHRKANPVSTYNSRGMTLISGMELHPIGPGGTAWHILGLGVPEDFVYPEPATGQDAVDAVAAVGGVSFCAHPYWCGFTSADVAQLKGILGIEVYNTGTRYIGKDYNMQCWDEMLNAGYRCNAIAVDDMHWEHDLYKGFTVILAEDKSPESILNALRKGAYYASQGPRFTRITLENGILTADFTPVINAIGMMRRSKAHCQNIQDAKGPGSENKEVTHMEIEISRFTDYTDFIRIQLQDTAGRFAWSNPIYLK